MKNNYSFNPQARISERISVNCEFEHAFDAIINAIKNMKKTKIKSANKVLGRIVIKTGMSLFSWGELLTVTLEAIDGKTKIEVISENKTFIGTQGIGSQVTIGRKNKKNIDKLFNAISKCI